MLSKDALVRSLLAVQAVVAVESAWAVSLVPGRSTDSSVCDLGPNTTRFFSSKVLIPAVASAEDQIAAQFRLAAQFVVESCADGQVLIAGGNTDVDTDSPALTQLANASCLVADVKRSEGTAAVGPYTHGTFELRCPISKISDLKVQLGVLEARDPLASLKSRLASAARPSNQASPTGSAGPAKDCSRVTLGSLLKGGGCP